MTPFSQTLRPETKQHSIPRTGLQILRHCIQNVVEMVTDHPLLPIYPSMIIELSWAHGCLRRNQILSLPCCWVWLRSDPWNVLEGMRATSALLIEEKVSRFNSLPSHWLPWWYLWKPQMTHWTLAWVPEWLCEESLLLTWNTALGLNCSLSHIIVRSLVIAA